MTLFKHLVTEAHRRSVWQVLGIYLFGAWAGWEVIGEITDRVGLPDWVPAFALILLIIGLPIVVATAVVQEGMPSRTPPPPPYQPADPTLLPMSHSETAPETPAAPLPARGLSIDYGRHHLIFTWPKAIAAGLIAFLGLGITAGGYMGMRNAGIGPFGSLLASGAIEQRERIIIADFHSASGDSSLAQAITEAFRVDFAQTSTVTIVEPAHVRLVLERMSHEAKAKLDADLARDVAIRDNIKAVIVGEVSAAGGKYVVATKLIHAKDASVLASFRETAADSSHIIDAVDKLSKRLREKLGESLRTIRAEKPLEAVSTPSLEALLKYTQANYALDTERNFEVAISLLEEALAIDSMFGMAWRKLAVAYGNSGTGGREKVVAAATKAYEYRDRMTDIERYHALGYYYYTIKDDMNKAISAYEMLLDRDPNFVPNNLGLAYKAIKEHEKAAAAFRETVRRDSTLAVGYTNLFAELRQQGQLPEAEQVLAAHARHFPDAPDTQMMESDLAMVRGDYDAAEAKIREAAQVRRNSLMWRARTNMQLANYAQMRGQLAAAERLRAEAAAAQVDRGNSWALLNHALDRAQISLTVRRDTVRAQRELAEALARHRLGDLPALQRPYVWIAWQHADVGDAKNASAYIAEWERNVPADLRGNERETRNMLDGMRAWAERRYADALATGRRAFDFSVCETCWAYDMARGFDDASQPDSAVAYYEKSMAEPPWSSGDLAWRFPLAHERLAELYEQNGDRERAKYHAARFVSFWEKADAELQPRVQAKRTQLQRLSPDR